MDKGEGTTSDQHHDCGLRMAHMRLRKKKARSRHGSREGGSDRYSTRRASARPIRKSVRGATLRGPQARARATHRGHTLTQDGRDRLTEQPQNSLRHFLRTSNSSSQEYINNRQLYGSLSNAPEASGGARLDVINYIDELSERTGSLPSGRVRPPICASTRTRARTAPNSA